MTESSNELYMLGLAVANIVKHREPRQVEESLYCLVFNSRVSDDEDGRIRFVNMDTGELWLSFLLLTESESARRHIDVLFRACVACSEWTHVDFKVGVVDQSRTWTSSQDS